jgi:hypothetical protein
MISQAIYLHTSLSQVYSKPWHHFML